ncbi:MAG: dockerin type I repeat-containing protein, partial [Verrucomicrobiota bacterium]|nr:dockerin type I repeat-containing protein [Verrucomicrobiota bacterium]
SPITVAIQVPSAACAPMQIASVVSRKTHSDVGSFDIPMPLGATSGVECRSGGAGGNHTLVVSFSNNISSGSASITAPAGGSVSGTPAFSGNTMTVNLTGIADVQQTSVSISGVTDSFGQAMPDTAVNIGFLVGDTNGDGSVNSSDALQTRGRSGAATDASNYRSDVNTDGFINTADVLVVRSRSGTSIAP